MSRPKFVPTKEQRLLVKSLAAYGIKHEAIARMVRLRSPKTLRKYFPEELALGAIEAVAQVSQTHYQMAKSGKHPASTIHFLNSRARWLDDQGGPVSPPEKREVSRIVWRIAEKRKENLPREGDNNPTAAAPTSDSSTSKEGEKQEAGPEAALATPDLEGPDAQQPPTEWTLQAPSAKEPDVFVYRPESRVNSGA
jgi:hypothetical protein